MAAAAAAAAPGSAAHVELRPMEAAHLPAVRAMNAALFPVKYHERAYQDALACAPVSQLAFEAGELVGALLGRLEAVPGGGAQLYIISLGVLAPHRGQGVGSRLLREVLALCAEDPAIARATLHMHAANADALRFYERHGFEAAETVPGYYRRLNPPDAVVLVRRLQPPPPADAAGCGGDGGGGGAGPAVASGGEMLH